MEALGILTGLLVLTGVTITLSALFRGWVFSWLWLWFAVPIFGVQPIGIAQAIGISLVVGYLTHQLNTDTNTNKEKDKESVSTKLISSTVSSITWSLLTLLIGYIVKGFM